MQPKISRHKNAPTCNFAVQAEMRTCPICIEEVPLVPCNACDFMACAKCYMQWTLEKINDGDVHIEMPSCMQCKNIHSTFTGKDQKKIKHAIKDKLFLNELPWMRATEAYIANENRKKDIVREIANKQIEKRRLQNALQNMRKRMADCNTSITVLQHKSSIVHQQTLCEQCSKPCVSQFCPDCDIMHCHKCNQIHSKDTQCDSNVEMNINAIQQTCRACPACLSSTFKTGGCDHVHCTSCGADWDWRTQKIIGVHQGNRPYLEEHCGGLPNEPLVEHYLGPTTIFHQSYIWAFYKFALRMRQFLMPRLSDANLHHTPESNHNSRLKYVEKKISMRQFKQAIIRTHKFTTKKYNLSLIIKTFVTSVEDVFQMAVYNDTDKTQMQTALQVLFNEYCIATYKLNLPYILRKQMSVIQEEGKALVSYSIAFSGSLAVQQCTNQC